MPECPLRPWGMVEMVASGPRARVSKLTIEPGHRTSLQAHRCRRELLVVISGTARIVFGDRVFIAAPGQVIHISYGAPHRIECVSEEPLTVMETRLGSYVEDDDLTRFEDDYGRPLCVSTAGLPGDANPPWLDPNRPAILDGFPEPSETF